MRRGAEPADGRAIGAILAFLENATRAATPCSARGHDEAARHFEAAIDLDADASSPRT